MTLCPFDAILEGDNMIDEKLLQILACPLCKAYVILKNDKIICTKCRRKYPIKDDIPIMLIEEAQTNDEEKK